MKDKKIGLVVEHFSFRSDVRDLVQDLSKKCDLVLYIDKADELDIKKLEYNYRIISEVNSKYNSLLKIFYYFFRIKHSLHKDAVSWKLRKISSQIRLKQLLQIAWFYVYEYIPGFFSYDFFLKLLRPGQDNISDLDAIICFTDIKNDELLSKCIKANIKLYIYMYSWDHPVKMKKIPLKNSEYLVWSNGLKNDLERIHYVPDSKINIVGSTQLSYAHDFESNEKPTDKIGYIYFIGTKARPEMFRQEIDLLKEISKFLIENKINIKIIFRPYPNITEEAKLLYLELQKINNIEFNFYHDDDYIFTREKIFKKFNMIKNSSLVIHTGGTFGLEVCIINSLNLYFTFEKSLLPSQKKVPFYLNLSSISAQHHLKKYINHPRPNVIKDEKQLKVALSDIFINLNVKKYYQYNYDVSPIVSLDSIENISDRFIEIIHRNT